MPRTEQRTRTYRFGPIERRGIVGSFRPGQVTCIVVACIAAVIVFRVATNAIGFLVALALIASAAVLAFVPIAGRTAEEWTPVLATWLATTLKGDRRFRSTAPTAGTIAKLDGRDARTSFELPGCLDGCELVAVPVDARDVGVLYDTRTHALTAVVAVRARAVGLLPTSEHEARLARWGQILAGLARTGGPVRRLQILQRALPADGDGLWRHFFDAREPSTPTDSELDRSYRSLLDDAKHVTQDHEILLAFQLDERRAWARAGRDSRAQRLSSREQAQAILLRELRTFVSRFEPMDVDVAGVLTAEQYLAAIRTGYDPYRNAEPSRAGDRVELVPGAFDFAPTAAEVAWGSYRTDGAVHRTYWIAQWPRLPVGPLFMTPLLLGAHAVHSVSVVVEPIAPDRSRRAVEAAISSDDADEQLRERRGFRTTARRRRQQDSTTLREEELASGHEEIRIAGYVTVTACNAAELDEACDRVEQAALQSYLELVPLWGEQDRGFVHGALPVARGLQSVRFGSML